MHHQKLLYVFEILIYNMMKKRYKDLILASILETCSRQGASKTKVVYMSNMNFNSIRPYLTLLINDGLLEVTDGSTVLYKITPKGLEALEHIKALEALIPGLKSSIESL